MAKDKIDKLFSDKLQGHQAIPSVDSWGAIEEALDKKMKRKIWPLIGIAASAVLAIISSWYMVSTSPESIQVEYAYADQVESNVDVPVNIVYIPVFIQIPSTSKEIIDYDLIKKPLVISELKPDSHFALVEAEQHKLVSDNAPNTNLELVTKEPVPVLIENANELLIASAKDDIKSTPSDAQKPLTIIYKQGNTTPKSKFTQAVDYMEDVRNGDKKLINFKKIRENIQSKLSSNKEVNSK